MHFHLGWSGPIESFGYKGYYTRDALYRSVNHQQGRKGSRQENLIVQNAKLDHPVSPKTTTASG
jgi:hypothetical protein